MSFSGKMIIRLKDGQNCRSIVIISRKSAQSLNLPAQSLVICRFQLKSHKRPALLRVFFSYLLMFSRRRNSEFWIVRSGLSRRHFLVSASCHKYHRPYSCEQSRISVSVALLPPAFRREEHGQQEVNSNRPPIVVKALPGNDQRIRGSCWHDSRSMRLKRRFPELEALPARADIPGQGFSTCIPPIYDTGALRSSRRCQASE